MKKSAERKLAELRAEQQRVEKELYDMRNSVTDAPVTVNAANKPAAADEADRCVGPFYRASVARSTPPLRPVGWVVDRLRKVPKCGTCV